LIARGFAVAMLALGVSAALAQSPPNPRLQADPGVVSDDMLTLVVGTRFVTSSADGGSARAQFTDSRIPVSTFNKTDHCVDEQALELAKEYFTTLGRLLGKAGHFYFVPDEQIQKSVSMCERLHNGPPHAWVPDKTKIIAFGQVVPTVDAPALEQSIR
jgi:hypothetical protein